MIKKISASSLLIFFLYFLSGCASKEIIKEEIIFNEKIALLKIDLEKRNLQFKVPQASKLDTVLIDTSKKLITLKFNKAFSFIPFRNESPQSGMPFAANVNEIYSSIKNYFGEPLNEYDFSIVTLNHKIEELIPNYFRDSSNYDYSRIPIAKERPLPVIQNISKAFIPSKGLFNRNILLWHSHGWYYNINGDRWEWQRPRLFQSVEDLIPMSFTIPYLIPMLENAGANIFVPRERDTQKNEVVNDNDNPKGKNYKEESFNEDHLWKTGIDSAFAYGTPPYPVNFNPFEKGTHRIIEADSKISGQVSWIPEIPEEGFYGVYVSYHSSGENVNDAKYIVYHSGEKTEFRINRQIGGNTWQYLGKFKFQKGFNPDSGKVVLVNISDDPVNKIISADAVRFGGGMGLVSRNGSTSGRPKFLEGARYWLQYAGMPDTLIYNLNKSSNDYNDDYQSRAEYGNFLYGSPFGPNKNRNIKGLGIPVDLSLAFHTDAGITNNDTTVGTLAIYSIEDIDSQFVFPDSISRIANRDLADIMQTQIVNDLRYKYDPAWNQRQLREAQYSEATRPNVPSVLLELLSHQNFLDMKFVLDPRFRFDVSRSIYKAVLRFLSIQYNFEYAIQPLPVDHFISEFNLSGDILLRWRPVHDPLEPTAKPDKYIVYTRINDGDFDNGVLADDSIFVFSKIERGNIYSFKVTAVNKGGESFPSEILSVCKMINEDPILIVNGFDRVSAPASIDAQNFAGFLNELDAGVPDKFDFNFTGTQFDFDTSSHYRSNDAPGWGASHADYETEIVAGNSFDYPFVHGNSIRNAGFSFVSASDESVSAGMTDLKKYKMVDLILGEEKQTHWQKSVMDSIKGIQFKAFPNELKDALSSYLNSEGNLFLSGAYVGNDLYSNSDSADIFFAEDKLKFKWVTDHAAYTGKVFCTDSIYKIDIDSFYFNTKLNDKIYAVESPDAVQNTKESKTILRYYENKFSAATAYLKEYGVVAFGFPFGTIIDSNTRDIMMKNVLMFFKLY